jgi:glycerol kinase
MMQFQADLLQIPIVRPAVTETTALGAAYLAGLAVGFWKNIESIATQWKVERVFEPGMSRGRVAELRSRWNDALARAGNWEPKAPPPAKRKKRPNRMTPPV